MEKKKLQNNTFKGKCSNCGDCCTIFTPITEDEINIISKYVSEHNIIPCNRKFGNNIWMKCCFRDEKTKSCKIYPVRPYVCKHFICNDKDWEKHRDEYENRAKYNSSKNKTIMATFDDLIYQDYSFLMYYIIEALESLHCKTEQEELNNLKLICNSIGRPDILEHITLTTSSGKEIKGSSI